MYANRAGRAGTIKYGGCEGRKGGGGHDVVSRLYAP